MPFTFAVLGDAPYDPEQEHLLERLIVQLNERDLDFVVHVGDVKEGSDSYEDATYERVVAQLSKLAHPFVFTPGDNDWADAPKAGEGDDPLERLAHVREAFFATDVPWRTPPGLVRQSEGGGPFVENALWTVEDVVCSSLHVVGADRKPDRHDDVVHAEYEERMAANVRWLESTFERAASSGAPAVVLFTHANAWPKRKAKAAKPGRGFTPVVHWLRDHVSDFGVPVLLAHGDKHQLIVDRPLWRDPEDGTTVIDLFLRLQVPGEHRVGAVEVTVDPQSADPFSLRPVRAPL